VRMPFFPAMQIVGLTLLGALLITMGLSKDWNVSWIVGVPWLGLLTIAYLTTGRSPLTGLTGRLDTRTGVLDGRTWSLVALARHHYTVRAEVFDRQTSANCGRPISHAIEPQSTAPCPGQRETGSVLLIVDANGTFFVERASSSLSCLLSKYARDSGGCRCRSARCQNGASGRTHNRRPP
jgi:hypothetical protein